MARKGRKTKQPKSPVERQPAAAPFRGAVLGQAQAVQLEPSLFPEIADPKKRAFIAAYAMTGRLTDAAAAAGVSLRTGWNWRNDGKDKVFVEALEVAKGIACDRIEAEIFRRGHDGVEEPVFQGGRLVGTVRKFSDTLLIFLAKGAMPEKYRERFEHTGKDGGPIEGRILMLPTNGREAAGDGR